MRPIKPDKHRSHRERAFRDQVLAAVRKKIARERIPCSEIVVSGRPMLTAVRARILRGEIDDISLSRALLIADAVGLDLIDDIVDRPAPAATPRPPSLADVLEQARAMQARPRRSNRSAMGMGDLFGMLA